MVPQKPSMSSVANVITCLYNYETTGVPTTTQVVNGQRLKHYISGDSYNEDIDVIQVVTPEEFIKEQIQETAESVFE